MELTKVPLWHQEIELDLPNFTVRGLVNWRTGQLAHLWRLNVFLFCISFSEHSMDSFSPPLTNHFCSILQVFSQVFPEMQSELPEECRKPTGHAALSGKPFIFQPFHSLVC